MVLLRDFTENDVEKLVSILNNESVTRFLSTKIPSPYTLQDAMWWVNEGSKGELIKAISYEDEMVGCIGVYHGEFEYQKSGEIGYWLAQEYWRKGITLAAINQLVNYVFNNTGIIRLSAPVFSDNQPSMRLLLKAGFKEEAILEKAIFKNGQYYNSHIFAKLRSF
ncbi:GNAT family N-acetyltransferase [Ningiella sp. W23]|uniref:GNAT family N-acetyltransferase n=1 Tax=Ningiella sp. W23 TaxID=3023715 RepID=UPI00375701B0